MSEQEKPNWLLRKVSAVTRTGQLLLSNNKEVTISAFSLPFFQSCIHLIKVLDIRGTDVSSLVGLPFLPKLHTILADSTEISTFNNFMAIRKATKVSFKNTPLSKDKNNKYKLTMLLICGNQLSSIDNKIIPNSLRAKAETYPPIVSELINRGWLVEYPCPDEDRFAELCIHFDLVQDKKETIDENDENREIIEKSDSEDDFDQIIQSYHQRQEAMFIEAESLFDIIPERNIEAELAEEISILFGRHGISVDANNDEHVIQAVEELCKRANSHGDMPASISEEEEIEN